MKDKFAARVAAEGANPALERILAEICRITHMGFAAIARVTDDRWVVCQVLDKIDFGLNPGDELEIKTTICDEIRQSGQAVVIDHVDADIEWQTHPVPMLYGFKSYASFPIILADGRFYGTLCAIDPYPRAISGAQVVALLKDFAAKVAAILSVEASSMGAPSLS